MASLGGPNIVTSGLVLSLDAANVKSYPGSGTTWRDLSGNGYNFAGTGSFSFSNNAIIFNRSNVTNTGTVFTLSNIANQLKIENFLASSFTIEVWCLPQTLSGSNVDATETLQSLITWPGFHNAMRFNQGSTTFASVWNSARTSEFAIDSTGSLLSISSFNQVIGIVDRGATTSLGYINGTQVYSTGSIPSSTMTSAQGVPPNVLNIGAARDTSNYKWFYTGSIAIVKLYNRALTATEVLQNYNATKSRFNL